MNTTKQLSYVAALVGRVVVSAPAEMAIFAAACGVMLYVVIFV